MRKHTAAGAAACLGMLVAIGLPASRAVIAAECLTSPQGPTPAGHHWYYRLDHATEQKCWYLKKVEAATKQPSPGRTGTEPGAARAKRSRLNREALFEEFLRWQKSQQDN